MKIGHTTKFIFDNGTFFAAHLDNGKVRLGMNDIKAFDLPVGHPHYEAAVNANTAEAVEAVFDDLHD